LKSGETDHSAFITRSYELAREAAARGDHPFSALLVVDGQIALECLNTVNSAGDKTRHPELDILRLAAKQLSPEEWTRATLYASTEPCTMCSGAIYWSEITELVYGCPTEVLGEIAGGSLVVPCRDIFSRGKRNMRVIGPVLAGAGARVHREFWPEKTG
jgi:tRNA(Arg) A34 adenosine deaminase TadA